MQIQMKNRTRVFLILIILIECNVFQRQKGTKSLNPFSSEIQMVGIMFKWMHAIPMLDRMDLQTFSICTIGFLFVWTMSYEFKRVPNEQQATIIKKNEIKKSWN